VARARLRNVAMARCRARGVAVRQSAQKRATPIARRCRRRVVAGLVATTVGSGSAERVRAAGRQTPLKAFSNILSWPDGPERAVWRRSKAWTVGGSRS